MPEPDLGGVLSAATQYGNEVEANVRAELAGRIDTLILERDDALRVAAENAARADTAEQKYADHMATHPVEGPRLTDLIGCRIFPQYSDKTYGRHDALYAWIKDSGLKRITGLLTPDMDAATLAFYQRLHTELGIKFWFTVGKPRVHYTAAQWTKIGAILDGPLAGAVEQLANWNEPNHRRNTNDPPLTDWEKHSGTQQAGLWSLGQPRGIDVCTVQLHSGSFAQHEADLRKVAPYLEGKFNRIAWHLYPRGGVGEALVQSFYDLYHTVLGQHPVSVTEAGYFDAANYTGGAIPVTPEQAAEYLPQHAQLYTDRGDRFGGFEFLNDPDPSKANREANLGWINTPSLDPATWTAKPVFTAMKALLTTV